MLLQVVLASHQFLAETWFTGLFVGLAGVGYGAFSLIKVCTSSNYLYYGLSCHSYIILCRANQLKLKYDVIPTYTLSLWLQLNRELVSIINTIFPSFTLMYCAHEFKNCSSFDLPVCMKYIASWKCTIMIPIKNIFLLFLMTQKYAEVWRLVNIKSTCWTPIDVQ